MDVCFIIFYPYGVIIIIAPSFLISSRELWHIPICGNLQQPSQDVSVHKFFDDPMLLELAKQAGQPQVIHPKLWYGPFTNRNMTNSWHLHRMRSSARTSESGMAVGTSTWMMQLKNPLCLTAHYSEPWHVIRCCNVLWSYLDCCFFRKAASGQQVSAISVVTLWIRNEQLTVESPVKPNRGAVREPWLWPWRRVEQKSWRWGEHARGMMLPT